MKEVAKYEKLIKYFSYCTRHPGITSTYFQCFNITYCDAIFMLNDNLQWPSQILVYFKHFSFYKWLHHVTVLFNSQKVSKTLNGKIINISILKCSIQMFNCTRHHGITSNYFKCFNITYCDTISMLNDNLQWVSQILVHFKHFRFYKWLHHVTELFNSQKVSKTLSGKVITISILKYSLQLLENSNDYTQQ